MVAQGLRLLPGQPARCCLGREAGAIALPSLPSQRQLQREERGGKPCGGKQAPSSPPGTEPGRGRWGYLSQRLCSSPVPPSPSAPCSAIC